MNIISAHGLGDNNKLFIINYSIIIKIICKFFPFEELLKYFNADNSHCILLELLLLFFKLSIEKFKGFKGDSLFSKKF